MRSKPKNSLKKRNDCIPLALLQYTVERSKETWTAGFQNRQRSLTELSDGVQNLVHYQTRRSLFSQIHFEQSRTIKLYLFLVKQLYEMTDHDRYKCKLPGGK